MDGPSLGGDPTQTADGTHDHADDNGSRQPHPHPHSTASPLAQLETSDRQSDTSIPPKPPNGHLGNNPRRRRGLCQNSQTPARPDSYIQRKYGVLLAVGLICWSFYVVVGCVCTPMIQRRSSSGLGRSVGLGTLIGFMPTWLIMVWSYIRIASTGPGFATKVLPKSLPPVNPPSTDYVPYRPPANTQSANKYPVDRDPSAPDPSEFAPINNLLPATRNDNHTRPTGNDLVQEDALIPRPIPQVETGPRWCRFCEIIKPDRTHHCRHCGVCVMQFDHHCLWIGQCVGWRNHLYFINFNFWTSVYCVYILIFLLVTTTKAANPDGQTIGAIAVAALFGLFTFAMLTTHMHLILTGRTTVESYQARDQREEEAAVLQKEFGYLWRNLEKRQVRGRWIEEWGGSPVDARWRHGTPRQMWEQEMGKDPLGWILPIGKPLGDGMHFPSNPRFGPHGEWLRKKDWPKDIV